MIKNWQLFLESKSEVSYETLSEVILFRNNSHQIEQVGDLMRKIDKFISVDLNEDLDDLTPVYTEEHKQFKVRIEEIVKRIKNDSNLSNTLLSIYSEVENVMKGFPKFYELEDLFLEFIDDGWHLNFEVKIFHEMIIEISNEMADLNITYDDFIALQIRCNSVLKRIKSLFDTKNCDILDSDYSKQGYKNVGTVKFQLIIK